MSHKSPTAGQAQIEAFETVENGILILANYQQQLTHNGSINLAIAS